MPLTPDSELELLFDSKYIPSSVQAALGDELRIRPLAASDYHRGHLGLLSGLTSAPDPSGGYDAYRARFNLLKTTNAAAPVPTYYTTAIVRATDDRLVAVGTVILEHKFLRDLGSVAHIEDIVVDPGVRGKSLGKRLIEALTGIAERTGAYKAILDCNKDNIAFYEKCGYTHKEYEMVRYTPQEVLNEAKASLKAS